MGKRGEETFNGKAELLDYIYSVYTGLTFKTENYIKENDFIIELGQITSRGNEAKTSDYCDVWRFKDGMISQVRSFVI